MIIRKVAILLPLFIFGIITPAWGDGVKSIDNAAYQGIIMKMGENEAAIQTKTGFAKEFVRMEKCEAPLEFWVFA